MLRTTRIPLLASLGVVFTISCAPAERTVAAAPGSSSAAGVKKDVPYVPTPNNVVAEMLKMGKVGKEDKLYDLGCGDGRIVVTAAKRFGTRGVGVDIDPKRIRESRENAREAGVTDLVRFEQGDLFTMDFKDATVVTLYLLPSVNLRLRPRLLQELRPGTRIVSHAFDMGDWRPDQQVDVDPRHRVYLWVVPARLEGQWQSVQAGAPRLALKQNFQDLNGTVRVGDREYPIQQGRINGHEVSFSAGQKLSDGTVRFQGRLEGSTLKGEMQMRDGEQVRKQAWEGTRS